MPTVDYTCQHCGHAFERVVLRGEEAHPVVCPQCKAREAIPKRGYTGLFDGIASFSSLGKDTN